MEYSVRFAPECGPTSLPNDQLPAVVFAVLAGKRRVFLAEQRMSKDLGKRLLEAAELNDPSLSRLEAVRQVIALRSVGEVINRPDFDLNPMEDAGDSSPTVCVDVGHSDEAEFIRLLRDKSCAYQTSIERDRFCSAASPHDETAHLSEGPRRLARTSRPVCAGCGLPDAEILCDHLHHVYVSGCQTHDGLNRMVTGGLCDAGRDFRAGAAQCKPGGQGCWEVRVKSPDEEHTVPVLSAIALPEAIEFLDAVWRLRMGHRLQSATRPTSLAALALPCGGREEFESRLSSLAEVFKAWHVPDDLVGDDSSKISGPLERLEACLRARVDRTELKTALNGLDALRYVNRLRNALQHNVSQPTHSLEACCRRLGVPYPPREWSKAWDAVRSSCASALALIRQTLQGMDEGAEQK